MRGSFFSRRMTTAWVAALFAGVLAAAAPWIGRLRPIPLGQRAADRFLVTSGADGGPGSLREAIFLADRGDGRMRVVIDAPVLTLTSPLPPIINAAGVAIEAARDMVRIDASRLVAGPVLDVASPGATISGLAIVGAPAQAILLRTNGARLTRTRMEHNGVGVFVMDGVTDLTVTDSDFEDNGVGIQLGAGSTGVRLRNNHFRRHGKAAIWSVAPTPPTGVSWTGVDITDNAFDSDDTSIVLINTVARVERNTFAQARVAAVLARGSAVTIRGNRMRSGLGFGINADALDHGVIAGNEINHHCGGGILLRETRATQISSNRIYSNGYGIVMFLGQDAGPNTVFDNLVMRNALDGLHVIGASPVIRRNRLLDNEGSGLRFSSLLVKGKPSVQSRPLVDANVLSGNRTDIPIVDEFRTSDRPSAGPAPDCAWRDSSIIASAARPGGQVQ
jgi:Right handed beta helix region